MPLGAAGRAGRRWPGALAGREHRGFRGSGIGKPEDDLPSRATALCQGRRGTVTGRGSGERGPSPQPIDVSAQPARKPNRSPGQVVSHGLDERLDALLGAPKT